MIHLFMTASGGVLLNFQVHSSFVPLSNFHRYNVAKVLRDMQELERHPSKFNILSTIIALEHYFVDVVEAVFEFPLVELSET